MKIKIAPRSAKISATLLLWLGGWLSLTIFAQHILEKIKTSFPGFIDPYCIWFFSIGLLFILLGGINPLKVIFYLGIADANPASWFKAEPQRGQSGADEELPPTV